MELDFLDRYSRIDSPIHRLAATTKLAASLLVIAAVVILSRSDVLLLTVVLITIVTILSRIPPRFLLTRLLILEPFVVGVSVLSLLQPEGWSNFLLLVTKSSLCLYVMLLLSNSTPFSEILRVLRRLRFPVLLLTTISLMYRYLFVLVDETDRMRRARASRTFSDKKSSTWKISATVISQLFIRTSERAERLYAAMCARGWQ